MLKQRPLQFSVSAAIKIDWLTKFIAWYYSFEVLEIFLILFSCQGDRVVIGDHYFRFNHPQQVHDGSRSCESSVGAVDFEFARNELVAAQSARYDSQSVKKLKF